MLTQAQRKTMNTMDADGRLTLPTEFRDILALNGETQVIIEIIDHGLVLRRADSALDQIAEEDRWFYTPEHLARIQLARQRPVDEDLRLSEEDLFRLIDEIPD